MDSYIFLIVRFDMTSPNLTWEFYTCDGKKCTTYICFLGAFTCIFSIDNSKPFLNVPGNPVIFCTYIYII